MFPTAMMCRCRRQRKRERTEIEQETDQVVRYGGAVECRRGSGIRVRLHCPRICWEAEGQSNAHMDVRALDKRDNPRAVLFNSQFATRFRPGDVTFGEVVVA